MGMQGGGGGGLQSEINVTPMVDVMLVLLIIFMVITPFLQSGVTVAIPRGMKNPDEDEAINKESAIIVAIPKDNQYYLNKTQVSIDELKSQVEKALAHKKEEEKIVYIKSGVEVSYGEVVKVIDRKSTRLNSSHSQISYAVFCLK